MDNIDTKSNFFFVGHGGMAGSVIVRKQNSLERSEVITATPDELKLLDSDALDAFLKGKGIDQVFLAVAKVG